MNEVTEKTEKIYEEVIASLTAEKIKLEAENKELRKIKEDESKPKPNTFARICQENNIRRKK